MVIFKTKIAVFPANELKEWIQEGDFFLTEPKKRLPQDYNTAKAC
ncbi:MAG: hypothetical protein ACOC44_01330 [Promethearchaeia archaeon]